MPAPARADEIDRVDGRNRPVGRVLRRDALRIGANFRTVHVIMSTTDDRVILQRLADGRERHPGRLGSSVAGYLHAGEDPETAALRRTREELGVIPHLRERGVVRMRDRQSDKFVSVFTGVTDHYHNALPEQIERLQELTRHEVSSLLTSNPDQFTPTFRRVWSYLHDT